MPNFLHSLTLPAILTGCLVLMTWLYLDKREELAVEKANVDAALAHAEQERELREAQEMAHEQELAREAERRLEAERAILEVDKARREYEKQANESLAIIRRLQTEAVPDECTQSANACGNTFVDAELVDSLRR